MSVGNCLVGKCQIGMCHEARESSFLLFFEWMDGMKRKKSSIKNQFRAAADSSGAEFKLRPLKGPPVL